MAPWEFLETGHDSENILLWSPVTGEISYDRAQYNPNLLGDCSDIDIFQELYVHVESRFTWRARGRVKVYGL